MASLDEIVPLTACGIVREPLPKLNYKQAFYTTTLAWHDVYFTGQINEWRSFEKVLAFRGSVDWDCHKAILGCRFTKPHASNTCFEHYRCGEETSSSGRFVNHALQVNSPVANELGYKTTFGDWKATASKAKLKEQEADSSDDDDDDDSEKHKVVPDYALLERQKCQPHAVGEAKTPWMHDLDLLWEKYRTGQNQNLLRRRLGQIAYYMHAFKLKYGFLTTYEQTFFLKWEQHPGKDFVLYCSDPIMHDSASTTNTVFLRESLLYLQKLADGPENDWHVTNIMDIGKPGDYTFKVKWAVKKDKKEASSDFNHRIDIAVQASEAPPMPRMDPGDISKFMEGLSLGGSVGNPGQSHSESKGKNKVKERKG
ncbi:hypothetical protein PHISCL_02477 [Aspergillus sclerotialis]|uniref:Uncharacterized protein n=1 Tax=Aspergillus sclerotialis TaxID=2070753 RepID=A0A3A2ZSB7_9EURO|nr:hypothetical protein PHISCL_02477 [Aspergillus sclerotialis]